jgi:hypothetical protein
MRTAADAQILLGKVRDGEQHISHCPCIAAKLLDKLLHLLIADRPSVAKGSPSDDVYDWVYHSEGVMMWLWWRRQWDQHDAFAKEWIIRLTSAILEEAHGDAKTQRGGYWRCATADLFVRSAKWGDDPAEFLVMPEHAFRGDSPTRYVFMERDRLGRKFESEQAFLLWQLEWLDPLYLAQHTTTLCQAYTFDQKKIYDLRGRLHHSGVSEAEASRKIDEVITARIARHEQELKDHYFDTAGNQHHRRYEWDRLHLAIRLDKAAKLFLIG